MPKDFLKALPEDKEETTHDTIMYKVREKQKDGSNNNYHYVAFRKIPRNVQTRKNCNNKRIRNKRNADTVLLINNKKIRNDIINEGQRFDPSSSENIKTKCANKVHPIVSELNRVNHVKKQNQVNYLNESETTNKYLYLLTKSQITINYIKENK